MTNPITVCTSGRPKECYIVLHTGSCTVTNTTCLRHVQVHKHKEAVLRIDVIYEILETLQT